jgi:hypothetical protein
MRLPNCRSSVVDTSVCPMVARCHDGAAGVPVELLVVVLHGFSILSGWGVVIGLAGRGPWRAGREWAARPN